MVTLKLRDVADYDDFISCLTEHAPLVELLDGRYAIHERTSYAQLRVAQEIYLTIESYVEENEVAGQVLTTCEIVLDQHTVLIPDIAFVETGDTTISVSDDRYSGVPEFVCEIATNGTRDYDMGDKLLAYLQAGVKEYWIVDPDRPAGERFTLYERITRAGALALPVFRQISGHNPATSRLFPGIEFEGDLR